jgi:DNA invertase Pin-like site-specific DNA recombinase
MMYARSISGPPPSRTNASSAAGAKPSVRKAGLAAARRAGRTGGRPPKLTDDDIEAAKALLANPDIGVTQIAHRLGVSPATLYRYIPAARTANTPGV